MKNLFSNVAMVGHLFVITTGKGLLPVPHSPTSYYLCAAEDLQVSSEVRLPVFYLDIPYLV